MRRIGGLLAACMLLLPLASCILTPGKFISTLDIRKDRSFTFTYVGEVIAEPPTSATEGKSEAEKEDGATASKRAKAESAEDRARMESLAQALSREYGYRSVRYLGKYHFAVDYAISGKLTHHFLFPFNVDGQIVIPFVAVELRGADRIRMKAPGYSPDGNSGGEMAGAIGPLGPPARQQGASELDGTFTLTTNAEIISQNQENGAQTLPDGSKRIVWTATPHTQEAPLASLKLDPLP